MSAFSNYWQRITPHRVDGTRRVRTNRRTIVIGVLFILILLLVVLHLALPSIAEREVNKRLANMGDYSGRVEHVSLALWRGNYTLHNLTITKRNSEIPVPLLEAPEVNISLSWRNLIHGGIVAEVEFVEPVVNFVDGEGDDNQSGAGVDWRERLENLVPIHLNDVTIRNGTVVFNNFVSKPQVDITTSQVNADIHNLTNVRDAEGQRVAELNATATVFESGRLESQAQFDPFNRPDTFSFALRILDIDVTQINDFTQAYANLDFESGNGELVLELEAENGRVTGYAKPLFQQLQIFNWEDETGEMKENPFRIAWEAIAEVVTEIFTNQPADQFGTRIEISGNIDDPDTSTFSAVIGIVRNAFGEALKPYFEGTHLRRREQ